MSGLGVRRGSRKTSLSNGRVVPLTITDAAGDHEEDKPIER